MNQPAPVVEPIVSAHQHDCQHIRRAPNHRVPARRWSRGPSALADRRLFAVSGAAQPGARPAVRLSDAPTAAVLDCPGQDGARGQRGCMGSRHHMGVGCPAGAESRRSRSPVGAATAGRAAKRRCYDGLGQRFAGIGPMRCISREISGNNSVVRYRAQRPCMPGRRCLECENVPLVVRRMAAHRPPIGWRIRSAPARGDGTTHRLRPTLRRADHFPPGAG